MNNLGFSNVILKVKQYKSNFEVFKSEDETQKVECNVDIN